jgi:hypothetical protein
MTQVFSGDRPILPKTARTGPGAGFALIASDFTFLAEKPTPSGLVVDVEVIFGKVFMKRRVGCACASPRPAQRISGGRRRGRCGGK